MLKDIFGQAWEAMLYNRRRTTITMVGMAWGIATVVLLLAYGAGFTHAIQAIFAQWGTNVIGVFPGRTSEQAGGDKAGTLVRFTQDDVDRIIAAVPGIDHISPAAYKDVIVQNDLHSYTWTVNGVRSVFQDIWKLDTDAGRFFNGAEEQQRAHVCVIGSESKTKLFSGQWAVGQTIRLNGVLFTIVGVLSPKMQEGGADNDRNRQIYVPFSTMSDLTDTKYLGGIWFNYQGNYQLIEQNLRATLASGTSLPRVRSQRHVRRKHHDGTAPVQHPLDGLAGPARFCGNAHARHCRNRPHEHHARRSAAAHA